MGISSFDSFALGGKKVGRAIYRAILASLDKVPGQYDLTPGSHMEASAFARAKLLARVWKAERRAGSMMDPNETLEGLAEREYEWGLIPGYADTVAQRRAAYAAARRLPAGGSRLNIEIALGELLGDDFIAYRTTLPSEIVNYPAACGGQPMNLQEPTVPRRLIRLVDDVSTNLGSPQEVEYEHVDPVPDLTETGELVSPLLTGDTENGGGEVLVVEPENRDLTERVTIVGLRKTNPEVPVDTQFFLTATFNKPHNPNCFATTQPWPWWESTQRWALVVLTPTAAADPEKRRKVHELMHRIARGVSTWHIGSSADGLTSVGPFTVGVGLLGITTIDSVAI